MPSRSYPDTDRRLEALINGCRKHPQLKKRLQSEVRNLEKKLRSLRTAKVRQRALTEKRLRATELCCTLTQQAKDAGAAVRDGALGFFGRRDERLADLGIKPQAKERPARRRL
jgi:hypothetical protein